MIPTLVLACAIPSMSSEAAIEEHVRGSDYRSCGLTGLYLVMQLRDSPVEFDRLKSLLGPPESDGTHSFADLSRTAEQIGLRSIGLQAGRDVLNRLPMPAIVHVRDHRRLNEPPHLLVLLRVDADGVVLLDPPMPPYFLSNELFAVVWTGNILVFPHDEEQLRSIRSMEWSKTISIIAFSAVLFAAGVAIFSAMRRCPIKYYLPQPRRTAVLVALISVLATGAAAAHHFRIGMPPRALLTFPQTVIDLGELDTGSFSTRVALRNDGDALLTIDSVMSSCTCAVGKSPEAVEPRGSAEIPVELSVTEGPRQARLSIESNDAQGVKRVMLTWVGRTEPVLVPSRIRVYQAPVDRPYERIIKLSYPGGPLASIPDLEKVECNAKNVNVRLIRSDDRGIPHGAGTRGESELRLSIDPPKEAGRFETECMLTLRYGERRPRLRLPISIEYLGGELTPEVGAVAFTAGRLGELTGLERVVRIAQRSKGGDIEVTDVPSWLSCRVDQDSHGDSALRFRVLSPPGENLSYTIHVARKGAAETRVPIQVRVFAP